MAFIGLDPGRIAAPFGPSHDGFNAALYMSGGRALLEEGALVSRFGASVNTASGDRIIYAHHPPLVYMEDAAIGAAFGPTETAARVPAVISSLTVLLLMAFVLPACGFRSGAAAFGVLFAFATPMFKMFGTMTEPHALGLAPMTCLLLLWQRLRSGFGVPQWALASSAAIATFTSWQAALFATAVAGALILLDRQRAAATAVIAGVCVSAVLLATWILWAYDGQTSDLVARVAHRLGATGPGHVTVRQMAHRQVTYLRDLFPVGGWLVVPIAAFGLFDTRTRPLVAVSLGTVLGYALLFKNGAYDHDYWLYCILLPLTLGGAVAADGVTRAFSGRRWLSKVPVAIGTALIAALAVTVWRPSGEEQQRRGAAHFGAQARGLNWPDGQRYAYHMFGDRGPTDLLPWLEFYARRQPFGVDGPESVSVREVVVRSVDGQLVMVGGGKAIDP